MPGREIFSAYGERQLPGAGYSEGWTYLCTVGMGCPFRKQGKILRNGTSSRSPRASPYMTYSQLPQESEPIRSPS